MSIWVGVLIYATGLVSGLLIGWVLWANVTVTAKDDGDRYVKINWDLK